MNPTLNQCKIG